MKKELTLITLIDLIFLMLLSLSGLALGVISEIIYYTAFVIPSVMGIAYIKIRGGYDTGEFTIGVKLTRGAVCDLIPLIAPTVSLIFAISYVTSVVMESFGFNDGFQITEGIWAALIVHAVIPAVAEEILFRYVPLKLMLPFSSRWAVILSSLFFALIHANLFQIPYAFAAGIIFALVNILTGSIIPSILLHFANNAISVIYMTRVTPDTLSLFYIILCCATAVSVVLIFIMRQRYRRVVAPLLSNKTAHFSLSPIALVALTLCIAVSNLFVA